MWRDFLAAIVSPKSSAAPKPPEPGTVSRWPDSIVAVPPTLAAPVSSTLKKCPFCAEEIQSAAVVCKHCSRDLLPMKSAAKPGPRWGRIFLVVAAVLAFPIVLVYCGADHQRFIKFDERRDVWHRECDAYRTTPLTDPIAFACNQELNELTAYAKRQGWD